MRTKLMTRFGLLAFLTAAATGASGCSTMNNTEKGVGLGALGGAGVGTLIGAATHNPKTGAVVGGLVGAAAGGAIGNSMDRADQQQREIRQTQAAVASANAQAIQQKLGMMDVVQMVQSGQDEQVIINQIRTSGSTFSLSPTDLDFLKTNNVPTRVVIEMQNARQKPVMIQQPAPRTVVVREEPTVIYERPSPIYVVGPPPPPPGVVYVGGTYHRRW